MNANYFVLVAASLTFATGFFVASIVWGIKWVLMSKERESSMSVQLLHIFSLRSIGASHNNNLTDDQVNKELYHYNHGTSGHKVDLISTESVSNKELYQYTHGTN